jgi:hypothetical protein
MIAAIQTARILQTCRPLSEFSSGGVNQSRPESGMQSRLAPDLLK